MQEEELSPLQLNVTHAPPHYLGWQSVMLSLELSCQRSAACALAPTLAAVYVSAIAEVSV